MGKYVYGVKFYKLGPLKQFVSCGCGYNIEHPPTFTIETKTVIGPKTGNKPRLTWISIQCECCKSISIRDVEDMDIYEDDLKF